ncbi:MAG: diphthine--ammonia ligase [Thermodesulfobacteriota bacterium]
MNSLHNREIFCSWSGGKDSCLALYRAVQQGGRPRRLVTMLTGDGSRSRSHGLPPAVLAAQATSLGIPLLTGQASWDDYEEVFLDRLALLRQEGLADGIFGDIDLPPHRQWVERVCSQHGIAAHLPLWQEARRDLLALFIDAGFSATIIVVNNARLPASFLGRRLDWDTVRALEAAGVDACGEEGEYHTVVTDGPLFATPVPLATGTVLSQDGCSFLEVFLAP